MARPAATAFLSQLLLHCLLGWLPLGGLYVSFLMAMKRTTYNVITALLGVQTAFAGGGGGGGGGGTICTLLRLLMTGDGINDWTQVIAGNSVTFTDSYGRSFVYNGATGDIN